MYKAIRPDNSKDALYSHITKTAKRKGLIIPLAFCITNTAKSKG